jgi:hypothetical protein
MTPTLSSPSPVLRRASGRQRSASARRRRANARHEVSSPVEQRLLARYTDPHGRAREVIARDGAAGSVLVVDRDQATRGDRRLVAHLAADEPAGNAALVCSCYLEDAGASRARCRPVVAEDARTPPFAAEREPDADLTPASEEVQLLDRLECRHRLELMRGALSIPELRWSRRCPRSSAPESGPVPVSLREVVASLESYEPACALSARALARYGGTGEVSTTVLRAELARVQESPIVLNRRLREVVLATVARQELSMSEIAIRCGRRKRDRRGNESGETSWLARRLGLLPEGGQSAPTPWIHSDVLALIARCGLGVSPREVEL